MLQKTNTNILLSKQNKDALLNNFIHQVTSVYGKDSIVYLAVTPLQSTPIINRIDLFEKIRSNQLRTYEYVSPDVNGLQYSTSVIVSLHAEYVQQAGAYLRAIADLVNCILYSFLISYFINFVNFCNEFKICICNYLYFKIYVNYSDIECITFFTDMFLYNMIYIYFSISYCNY